MSIQEKIRKDVEAVTEEWLNTDYLKEKKLFVIGCSTSEVLGERIGTAGTEEVAKLLFDALQSLQSRSGIYLAFQCCEHLNRALVVEREAAEAFDLEEVSAVPVPEAGGSMASYSFKEMEDAVLVESLNGKAHAGMDIGETFIGMHLKNVVVPLRFTQRNIGEARLTVARTRPKLIGGVRAKYE